MRQPFIQTGLILLTLLLAFAVRVNALNSESIWHDEGWSIRAIQSPFGTPDDNTPYGYYAVLHLLQQTGIGESPFAYRFGSVLIGLLTVALVMRVGLRWYGATAGIGAGILTAISPLLWEYAQEVRAYVAVPLFAVALLAIGQRLLRQDRDLSWHWWGLLLITEILGIYTHNLVVPVIIWLNIAVGVVWLWRRDWSRLIIWAFTQALLVVSYLPWLSTQEPSGTPLNSTPTLGFDLAVDVWRAYFLPVLAQHQLTEETIYIDILGVLLIGLLGWLVYRQRTVESWLVASHVLLVPLLSAVLIIVADIDFHPRYFIAAVPVTMLAMTAAARLIQPYAVVLLVLLVAFVSQSSINDVLDTRIYQHDDFESLARYYATLPEETVILIPFDREPALENYYAERFDIRARMVTVPLHSDEETALEHIQRLVPAEGDRPIEFLTWFQLPADARGMYPCLLTASTNDPMPPPQTFFGLQTQHYNLTRSPEIEPVLANPQYDRLAFRHGAILSSRQGLCLRTRWTLPEDIDVDLKVAASLWQEAHEVNRTDADIARPDQVPTSLWQAEQTGEAYNLLRLPPGAPRTGYGVRLRVYHDGEPNGLLLRGESVGVEGTVYQLPEAITLTGAPLDSPPPEPMVVSDNAVDGVIDGSQPFEVTLIINGIEPRSVRLASIRLEGENEDWLVPRSAAYDGTAVLAWESFEIPPEAQGTANLYVDEVLVKTYEVVQVERLMDAPDYELEVNEKFPSVGNLVGMTLETNTAQVGEPFMVSLVWQANAATDLAYQIFVQLLDMDGRLLAQSDSAPVNGARPTTGWLPGEYIIDNHQLGFRVDNYEGPATLIAGFYDPATGERVLSGEGDDFVQLPVDVNVEQ